MSKTIIKSLNSTYILHIIDLYNPYKRKLSLISGKIAYIRKREEYFIENSKTNFCDEIDEEIFKSINEKYPDVEKTTETLTFNTDLIVLEQLHINETNPIECKIQLSIKPYTTFKIFVFLPIDRCYLKEKKFIFNCSQEDLADVIAKLKRIDFLGNDEKKLLQKYTPKI
ncbi:hypothetical protein [uncultured Chryseobacterium sp.]|uniref:hypothetical protein n=1 Tax=uncultured Chryseobacterium sp. TaxID=259322 RepID=UPI0037488A9F